MIAVLSTFEKPHLLFACLLSLAPYSASVWAANDTDPKPSSHELKQHCALTLIQSPSQHEQITNPSKEIFAALQISQQLQDQDRAILLRVVLASEHATYGAAVKIISLLELKPLASTNEEVLLVEHVVEKFVKSQQMMATTSRMDNTRLIVDFIVSRNYPIRKKVEMFERFIQSPGQEHFAIDTILGYMSAVITTGAFDFGDAQAARKLLAEINAIEPSPKLENLQLVLKQALLAR